jgi:phosphoserine phosphatase RsbU/P
MRVTIPALVTPPTLEIIREQELDEARIIQHSLVPVESLSSGEVSVTHRLQSVHTVGGDFLDYFELSDRTVGLYLGDVSGKGLPGALYAALVVGTLRGVHKTGESPAAVLSLLNRRLCVRSISSRYSTVSYAVFDPRTRQMLISSAGMYGPLLLTRRGCVNLRLSGMPPGLFSNAQYDVSSVAIEPGESVLFITDGIAEMRKSDSGILGVEHLVDICARLYTEEPSKLLDVVFAAAEEADPNNQSDDRAAVVFHLAE